MEKRLLLSFILSFLVLYIWATFISPPPSSRPIVSQDAYLEADKSEKEVAETSPAVIESEQLVPKQPPAKEEIYSIESDRLYVEISGTGGSIQSIFLKDFLYEVPVDDISGLKAFGGVNYAVEHKTKGEIVLTAERDGIAVQRTYELSEDGFDLISRFVVRNASEMSKKINIEFQAYAIDGTRLDKKEDSGIEKRDHSLFEYVLMGEGGEKRKSSAFKFKEKEGQIFDTANQWVGFRDRYFSVIVKPLFESDYYGLKILNENHAAVEIGERNVSLAPRSSQEYNFFIYAGPEDKAILNAYPYEFDDIKMFYRFGLFDVVAKFIYWMMHAIQSFIPNWGVVILVLSVIIYFSMYPFTLKGMASMKRMQSMQPKVSALREKYKNNPQKLNKEIMELYKEHKINPMGGCLPFLLQMPVFIGLYQVLWRDVSLKGANFLWIKDLSAPDRLFELPVTIPFLGSEFNLLPVLMMIIMFVQQKVSAKNMHLTDPAQIAQQKLMMRIMPVFLGVIFYKFASGLCLYFTMFYIFSTFTQWKMAKEKA